MVQYGRFDTAFGLVAATSDDAGRLTSLVFLEGDAPCKEPHEGMIWNDAAFGEVKAQLDEYFFGTRVSFDLPLAPIGTKFQKTVWAALMTIPNGETRTYGELARMLGKPGSARAVGRANATNRIAVIVPCHRILGADGSLTGYAGGLRLKQRLLALEADHYSR